MGHTLKAKPRPKIIQIANGKHGLLALTEDGDVWAFGNVSGRWHKLPPLLGRDERTPAHALEA